MPPDDAWAFILLVLLPYCLTAVHILPPQIYRSSGTSAAFCSRYNTKFFSLKKKWTAIKLLALFCAVTREDPEVARANT